MPGTYEALVRLHRWKVDEKSRVLAALLEESQALADKAAALLAEVEQERRIASESIEAGRLFGAYASQAHERKRRLQQQRSRMEFSINQAREALREAMGEAKKFEIAHEAELKRARAKSKAKEDQALDEAALNGYLRRREGQNDDQ
jgi:flagellar export protein FliJ